MSWPKAPPMDLTPSCLYCVPFVLPSFVHVSFVFCFLCSCTALGCFLFLLSYDFLSWQVMFLYRTWLIELSDWIVRITCLLAWVWLMPFFWIYNEATTSMVSPSCFASSFPQQTVLHWVSLRVTLDPQVLVLFTVYSLQSFRCQVSLKSWLAHIQLQLATIIVLGCNI
jgi:hypothetical protein